MAQTRTGWEQDVVGPPREDDVIVLDRAGTPAVGVVQFDRGLGPRHHDREFTVLTGAESIRGLLSESEDAAAALAVAALGAVEGERTAPVTTTLVNGRRVVVEFTALADHEAVAHVRPVAVGADRQPARPGRAEGSVPYLERWELREVLAGATSTSLGVGAIVVALEDFAAATAGHDRTDTDRLLEILVERICGASRRADHVVRMGPYEFAVVAPSVASRHVVESVASRITEAVERPIFLGGRGTRLRPIVVHRWASADRSALAVLDDADHALHEVRRTRPVPLLDLEVPGAGAEPERG